MIEVCSTFYINIDESIVEYFLFNEDSTKRMQENKAVVATGASVKGNQIGGAWIISDIDRSFDISNKLFHKRWNDNTSGAAEVIVLFELITVIERRCCHIITRR